MQNKTAKQVNWNRIFTAVDAITNGYNNLFEVLNDEWNKSDYTDPMKFRKDFVDKYVERKITSDPDQARAYANRVACEAGFRIRGKGAGRKVGKATNKPSGKGVTAEQLAHMARALDSKGVKKLIALLVAM